MKNIGLDEETKDIMSDFGYDLSTIKHTFVFFSKCVEEDFYSDTRVELYNIAKILRFFIQKVKKDYEKIQDKLGVQR